MIAPLFCPSLDVAHRQAIGQHFVAAMAAHFPAVEARLADHLPADATPRARLGNSLIASLRISRATRWEVLKPGSTDAYLPITLTLDITNGATGEVVFTRTRSDIAQGSFSTDGVDAGLTAQFGAQIDRTLQALVTDAAQAWKPWSLEAKVVGRSGDGWIIDRGRTHGLRKGDAIGADGEILYAGPDYALVRPVLGRYENGQSLRRTAIAPAEMLAKPSVLSVMAALPEGYAAPYLTQIFEDALGARGGFAPVPINPGFVNLRSMALGEAQAPAITPRSLPDYVASIGVGLLPSVRYASNVPGVMVERHEAYAFVTLVDGSGRVVASFRGADLIVDEIAGGMGFSSDQRRDTVIRNALTKAAQQMATFRPQSATMSIEKQGGRMLIHDQGGALPQGVQLTVLRNAGRIGGLKGPVLVPVGEVTTAEAVDGGMFAADAGIEPIDLHGGDVVALENGGSPLVSRQRVTQCAQPDGTMQLEDRGHVAVPLWSLAAMPSFASRFGAPVYLADLPQRLADYDVHFADWKNFAPARPIAASRCITPVISISPTVGGYGLTAGYMVMQGGQKIGSAGLQAVLTPTRLPESATPADRDAMLQQDLADRLLPLAEKAAATLRPAG